MVSQNKTRITVSLPNEVVEILTEIETKSKFTKSIVITEALIEYFNSINKMLAKEKENC